MERTIVYKEKVFEELKRAIISRTYQPGEILNERKLASEMDVSRTPVREAIQLLANEGWVKVIPWKGAVVQSVTLQDIEESMQLRMAIEPVVIDLVIYKIGEKEIGYLEKLFEEQVTLAQSGDAEKFILLDQEFHLFLAELTGNQRLCQIMRQLRDIHLRIGVEAMQQSHRFPEIIEEHGNILECLKTKEILGARRAMLEHLLVTHRSVVRHIKSLEQRGGKNEN